MLPYTLPLNDSTNIRYANNSNLLYRENPLPSSKIKNILESLPPVSATSYKAPNPNSCSLSQPMSKTTAKRPQLGCIGPKLSQKAGLRHSNLSEVLQGYEEGT